MDPVAIFVSGLMIGSVTILLGQAFGRRRLIGRAQGNRDMAGLR